MKLFSLLMMAPILNLAYKELEFDKIPQEASFTFEEICHLEGFPVEKHIITTEDYYKLTFFRIKKQNFKQNSPPIYIQHGLIDSSDSFIVNYRQNAPAFYLADLGYDVWIGNTRGNKYSKDHINQNKKQFWDFSFQQMAQHDLPASFQYIANLTNQTKINYIGHSQGTLIMFAALSENQQTIQKYLGKFIALAPIFYIKNQQSDLLRKLNHIQKYTNLLYDLGIYQVLESNKLEFRFNSLVCNLIPELCSFGLRQICDLRPELDNPERYSIVFGHYPAGASLRNIQHFAQMMDYDKFQLKKFDYGSKVNLLKYGQIIPPDYNISNIKADMFLMSGKYDLLADMVDVNHLVNELQVQNPNLYHKVYEAGHATFIWGKNDQILSDIKNILND